MSAHSKQQGMTLVEACALLVGALGRPTAAEIHEFLVADGWQVSRGSVKQALSDLRGAVVDVAVQGKPGHGGRYPTRWRQTEAARAWLDGLDRDGWCGS